MELSPSMAALLHVHFSRADVVMAMGLAGTGSPANEGAGFAEPREKACQ
jgi:hypothetical protein